MTEKEATYCRELFPIRQWIRRHYTKIRKKHYATCNICLEWISIRPSSLLHNHLVQEHSNELTEEEKKDELIHWIWDHCTIKDTQNAICNICGSKLKYYNQKDFGNVRYHLQKMHGIFPPYTDDM